MTLIVIAGRWRAPPLMSDHGSRGRSRSCCAGYAVSPANYEFGGQEFESLRARQHLVTTYRAKLLAFYGICKEARIRGQCLHPHSMKTLVLFKGASQPRFPQGP